MSTLSNEQAKKVLESNDGFSVLGFSMLVTRLRMVYKKDSSVRSLEQCTKELNEFIDKFTLLMSADLDTIETLYNE